jgi:hypothetical protein
VVWIQAAEVSIYCQAWKNGNQPSVSTPREILDHLSILPMGVKLGFSLRNRLKVFCNRVLERIIVTNRVEVTGRRRLKNCMLHNLYLALLG